MAVTVWPPTLQGGSKHPHAAQRPLCRRPPPLALCTRGVGPVRRRPGRRPPRRPRPDPAFLRDHCTVCHNETDKRGRLDLTRLAFDPKTPPTWPLWVKVHDRVTAGEMPPKTRARPVAASAKRTSSREPGEIGAPPRSGRPWPARAERSCDASTARSTRTPCATCSASPGHRSPTGCPRTARPTAATKAVRRSTYPTSRCPGS